MKILVSAIACHPEWGSENAVGWKAVQALAQSHEVHVLTSTWNQDGIEHYATKFSMRNPSFTYFGTSQRYHENRLIARMQSWLRYIDWTKESLTHARILHARNSYDLIHHITYSSWRVPSPLWQLECPLVWGPVGGVSEYPWHLLHKLSLPSLTFEIFRNLTNRFYNRSRALRNCIRNSQAIIASNKETYNKLIEHRESNKGLYTLSPAFYTDEQINALSIDPAEKPPTDPFRLFAGGNIIGSKGITFALEAIKIAIGQNVPCHFLIASNGPEVPYLQRQARRLKIEHFVEFHSGFQGKAYYEKLKEFHVFLLPSFRENAPGTILEAMLAGCVPIVVDASAQGDLVSKEFGFKVATENSIQIVSGIANFLITLYRNNSIRIEMGKNASEYVATHFREEKYLQDVNKIYMKALNL